MIHRASTGPDGLWRALSWALPSSAVLTVAIVGISARQSEAFLAARLYGGSACEPGTLRAIVAWSFGNVVRRSQPYVGEVVLRVSGAYGAVLQRRAATTSDGAVSFDAMPEFPPERLGLYTAESDAPLVALRVDCPDRSPPTEAEPTEEATDASSSGGWIEGHTRGALTLRVGIVRGVLAVPFPAELVVEVNDAGVPVSGVRLDVQAVGAELLGAPTPTDAAGVSRFELRPEAHVVELTIEAEHRMDLAADALSGRWFGGLPVVPGAMVTFRRDDVLFVASPIPREFAYVDLVASDRVIAALNVPLQANGFDVVGSYPLPSIARRADPASLFAVVSSEPDLRSMARVGWPLDTADSRVRAARDVHTKLLIDGFVERREQHAGGARGRRMVASGWVLVCAAGEVLVLWRLTRRPGGAPAGVAATGVTATGFDAPTRGRIWALGCVALGLLGLAAFAWFL